MLGTTTIQCGLRHAFLRSRLTHKRSHLSSPHIEPRRRETRNRPIGTNLANNQTAVLNQRRTHVEPTTKKKRKKKQTKIQQQKRKKKIENIDTHQHTPTQTGRRVARRTRPNQRKSWRGRFTWRARAQIYCRRADHCLLRNALLSRSRSQNRQYCQHDKRQLRMYDRTLVLDLHARPNQTYRSNACGQKVSVTEETPP